jgi:hypothetical protein
MVEMKEWVKKYLYFRVILNLEIAIFYNRRNLKGCWKPDGAFNPSMYGVATNNDDRFSLA